MKTSDFELYCGFVTSGVWIIYSEKLIWIIDSVHLIVDYNSEYLIWIINSVHLIWIIDSVCHIWSIDSASYLDYKLCVSFGSLTLCVPNLDLLRASHWDQRLCVLSFGLSLCALLGSPTQHARLPPLDSGFPRNVTVARPFTNPVSLSSPQRGRPPTTMPPGDLFYIY